MNRNKQIVRLGILGTIVNVVLVIFKLIMGFLSGSIAIILDGVNNLGDALGSIITIVGAYFSKRRPDREHPFGYGRIEYFASVLIAVIILYTGLTAMEQSIGKIISPKPIEFSVVVVIVLAGAVFIKFFFGFYLKKKGSKINAQAVVASGSDAIMDSFISAATLVSLYVYYFWHINIDGYLGAAISLLILKTGFDILKEALGSIIGKRTDSVLIKKIEKVILAFPEVEGAYDLILHDYGPDDMIGAIHIEVNDKMTAKEIDSLSRRIVAEVYYNFGIVLTIGIYATNTNTPYLILMKKKIRSMVDQIPMIIQMHGFYVNEKRHLIMFDVVIDFRAEDPEKIIEDLKKKIEKEYPEYKIRINKDTDFSN